MLNPFAEIILIMTKEIYEFICPDDCEPTRIDLWLKSKLDGAGKQFSRTYIQKLVDDGRVAVNGIVRKRNFKVSAKDKIKVEIPPLGKMSVEGEDIPLDIIYEDEYIIAINKPPGMVVHPAPGNERSTLVNALLSHCKDLSGIGGVLRPGIVHRLDKETSGIMLAAKTDATHTNLSEQLKNRKIKKVYEGIVIGAMKDHDGIIEARLGRSQKNRKLIAVEENKGREAVTEYRVRERFEQFTYLEIMPKTGRTHQIRVHLAYLGHPILGDKVYLPNRIKTINITNKNKTLITELRKVDRHLLHSRRLCFQHPNSDKYMELEAPLPDDFKRALVLLRRKS